MAPYRKASTAIGILSSILYEGMRCGLFAGGKMAAHCWTVASLFEDTPQALACRAISLSGHVSPHTGHAMRCILALSASSSCFSASSAVRGTSGCHVSRGRLVGGVMRQATRVASPLRSAGESHGGQFLAVDAMSPVDDGSCVDRACTPRRSAVCKCARYGCDHDMVSRYDIGTRNPPACASASDRDSQRVFSALLHQELVCSY